MILGGDLPRGRSSNPSPVSTDGVSAGDDSTHDGLSDTGPLREIALRLARALEVLVQRHAGLIIRFRIGGQPVFEILRRYPLPVRLSPWATT